MNKIMIICIGNICRSPMAEAMLAAKLLPKRPEISISSSGLQAMVNHHADPISQELMLERGLDISQHQARQFTAEMAFESDLILTMNTEQQQQVESQLPSMRGRVHRLGKWGEFDVPDPYKRSRVIFEQALALIELGLMEWSKILWD